MDLEKNRIKTKLTLPFIPAKNLKTNVVVLPTTAQGDGRLVATGPGWVLSVLGVPNQTLATTPNAVAALRQHRSGIFNVPSSLFAEAEALHGRQRLKAMFENMAETLEANSDLLGTMFTERALSTAQSAIADVLDEYEEVETRAARPRRMAVSGRR